jgi:hypothetical protein
MDGVQVQQYSAALRVGFIASNFSSSNAASDITVIFGMPALCKYS